MVGNVPFGDEVQPPPPTHHHTPHQRCTQHLTRSKHKRSLRSRDARQRRASQRIIPRARRRRECRSWLSSDLTSRTLSHRRLQLDYSKQQQATPTQPDATYFANFSRGFSSSREKSHRTTRPPTTSAQTADQQPAADPSCRGDTTRADGNTLEPIGSKHT